MSKVKKEKKEPKYLIEATVNEQTTKIGAESVWEGIEKLETPAEILSETIIKVTKGGKTAELILWAGKAQMFFHNLDNRRIASDNLSDQLG